jgi:hypothetical protein
MHITRLKVISRYVVSEATESEAGSLMVTLSPIEIKSSNASFYAAVYGWRFGRIVADGSRVVGLPEVSLIPCGEEASKYRDVGDTAAVLTG